MSSPFRRRWYFGLGVLTATLAVGANAVVFTIVNALWARPRPIVDPDRVVVVLHRTVPDNGSRFSDRALAQLRTLRIFDNVAGQVVTSDRILRADLMPHIVLDRVGREVETSGVTAEYFGVLGLRILGRDFTSQEDQANASPAAIISDRLWRTSFAGARDLLGATVPAWPRPVQIIGIAPPRFQGALRGENVDLWVPHNLLPQLTWPPRLFGPQAPVQMINLCRLRPGLLLAAAREGFPRDYLAQGRNPGDLELVLVGRLFGAPDLPMGLSLHRRGRQAPRAAPRQPAALSVSAALCYAPGRHQQRGGRRRAAAAR
jgi:hypothetical protein